MYILSISWLGVVKSEHTNMDKCKCKIESKLIIIEIMCCLCEINMLNYIDDFDFALKSEVQNVKNVEN